MTRALASLLALIVSSPSPAWAVWSVPLAWDAPTTHTDGSPADPAEIGGYVLHGGTTSQQYTITVDVGNVLSAVLTHLADGTAYYAVVTAYDTTGVSSTFSAPALVLTPPSPPGDTTPPTVQLTAPMTGSTVPKKTTVTLIATASDNVGVTSIAFFVNGTLTCTATASPSSCGWHVPAPPNRRYTLQAKAYDAAANMGVSKTVSVTSR